MLHRAWTAGLLTATFVNQDLKYKINSITGRRYAHDFLCPLKFLGRPTSQVILNHADDLR